MLADLHIEDRDGVIVARVEGEIDMSNAEQIGSSLLKDVGNAALGLVIDLSGTRYVDSAGIQMFYEVREQLKVRAQRMALAVPAGSATERTFQLVDAARVLGLTNSLDHAVAAITGSDPVTVSDK
jgi:anti-anti-sigma factor